LTGIVDLDGDGDVDHTVVFDVWTFEASTSADLHQAQKAPAESLGRAG